MTDTNQLPPSEREAFEAFAQNCPMGKYSIARRGDGYDSSHTQLMWDAWQARAQVQGEAFGYIHHFTAHDESGALIDTTWEADGCADPLPHPTFPSMWKWAHCTPFYTTQQPAQATQAEVTDEPVYQICKKDSQSISSAWIDVEKQAYEDAGIYPEYGRRTLYAHPAPGVPDDVVRDAERYRWLKAYDQNSEDMGICKWVDEGWSGQWVIEHDPDTYIDAAMLAAKEAK